MEDLLPYLHFVVLPQVIDALIIGVALALVALGLTMIFGLLDVINLAHGDIYMLGGYAAFTLIGWGAGYWGALVLVPILVGLVGWGLEELGIRPLLPRPDRAIVTLLLTFGVSLILRDLAQVIWGTETHAIQAPFSGIVSAAGVIVPSYRLFVFAVGLVVILATWWMVYRTQIGAVLRATAVDPTMVASFGIPIRLVYGCNVFLWLRPRRAGRRVARPDLCGIPDHGPRFSRHGICRGHCGRHGQHRRRRGRRAVAGASAGPRESLDSAGVG